MASYRLLGLGAGPTCGVKPKPSLPGKMPCRNITVNPAEMVGLGRPPPTVSTHTVRNSGDTNIVPRPSTPPSSRCIRCPPPLGLDDGFLCLTAKNTTFQPFMFLQSHLWLERVLGWVGCTLEELQFVSPRKAQVPATRPHRSLDLTGIYKMSHATLV